MGQQYDPEWKFTIADLYSFKLGLHKELINSICSGAVKEYSLELELRSLAKKWTEKDFKLIKHFARTRTPESKANSGNSSKKVCGVLFHKSTDTILFLLLMQHCVRLEKNVYICLFNYFVEWEIRAKSNKAS